MVKDVDGDEKMKEEPEDSQEEEDDDEPVCILCSVPFFNRSLLVPTVWCPPL